MILNTQMSHHQLKMYETILKQFNRVRGTVGRVVRKHI